MVRHGHDAGASTAEIYRTFARHEARGRSPAYESLAEAVAGDAAVLRFLVSLPPEKRQPNLLFAAARYLLGAPADMTRLRDLVSERGAELSEVMLARRTQTNEPPAAPRCCRPWPAAAAAGPDRGRGQRRAHPAVRPLLLRLRRSPIGGQDRQAPTLRCEPSGPVPLPARLPVIAWRAGLDLNPLDVHRDDDVRWLSCLVWPGEGDREHRLAAAIAAARRDPPAVHRGDLIDDLPALAAQAPAGATLVVYHSSVLAYVAPERRLEFADLVRGLPATWLSQEGPAVLSSVPVAAYPGDPYLLVRDGRTPLALADGHGTWLRWLPGPA